ncbi:ABC transporter substrate-binding protein [Paenibacillus piri]|uniref:Carbohydrate ABC transporter substrate-binding protein n=1 Tax=Paenibacillus piri TaxID=2547395 RepID=A0A4R5L012_9BACL|nr:ABC transporter substrate-binding protein [Paenibacillus piri]TDG00798.1 carbohydrate ABC transporter substrate-binding protein [Paenibacillus piri]
MSGKSIIALLLGLSLAFAVTGCSASGPSAVTPKAPKIKLELLTNKSDTMETMDKIIARFRERYPNVEIEQEAPPNMLKVLAMRFSTNTPPDLFTVYPTAPSMRQPVKSGYLTDLTGDPVLSNVRPDFLEFSRTGGKNYAVPLALEGYGIIYNTAMFRELNLDIPQTYAELLNICERLKAAGITPFIFADKDFTYVRRISSVLLGLDNPGIIPYFENVMAGRDHIQDSVQLIGMATKTMELRKYGQRDSLDTSIENAVREFAGGRAAMFFNGMWEVNTIKRTNPDLDVAMFPFPAERKGDTRVAMQVGTAFGIPKQSKTMAEAKQFLSFLTTTEMAQLFSDETGNISIINGVKHTTKENGGIAEYALAGKLFRAADSPWTMSMQDEFGKAVQELIAGGGLDTFMRKMEETFYRAEE